MIVELFITSCADKAETAYSRQWSAINNNITHYSVVETSMFVGAELMSAFNKLKHNLSDNLPSLLFDKKA